MTSYRVRLFVFGFVLSALCADASFAERRFPHILLIAVDTLRLDRLSAYGYARETSPAIDELLAEGARFDQMRVVEPLTAPSMVSMLTSLHPHEHGTTRNGLTMRPGLLSLGTILGRRGYETAAFVGNWTLRAKMTGLGDHFEHFAEVLNRKRYFGLFNAEATADDLTETALDWIEETRREQPNLPFFAWVHYVEPHAPYRVQSDYLERLGLDRRGEKDLTPSDRYDSEVAFVDNAIGELLEGVRTQVESGELLVVFVSDHGESLGEHKYWGHGRHLYEPTLHVPFGVAWEGRIAPGSVVGDLASSLDLAPTVLGLIGLPAPEAFRGHDWSSQLKGDVDPPPGPTATFHQAHKGALRGGGGEAARRKGLLEVGWVNGTQKEILSVRGRNLRVLYDLETDPKELEDAAGNDEPSEVLDTWLEAVRAGLEAADDLPVEALSEDEIERLRALGYID